MNIAGTVLAAGMLVLAGCGTASVGADVPGGLDVAAEDDGGSDNLACGGDTPWPLPDGGGCAGCLNSTHCLDPDAICDLDDHQCKVISIDTPRCGWRTCDDGQEGECCVDADCAGGCAGAIERCGAHHRCELEQPDPCNGQCSGTAFPVCLVIDNVPQCVRCGQDSDCGGANLSCTCNGDHVCTQPDGTSCNRPSIVDSWCYVDADCTGIDSTCTCAGDPVFMCLFPDGAPCAPPECGALCSTDADCPPGRDGLSLPCSSSGGAGFCYDPTGACGSPACCANGQSCFDLVSAAAEAMKAPTGWIPGQSAVCTCDDVHPCLGGAACTRVDTLCAVPELADRLCPGGALPAVPFPERVCGDLQPLIDLLKGLPAAR